MERGEAVILGVLSRLKSPVGRTKFVKLVYLADNCHSEQLGRSLTEFSYCWDEFGPNAVGNQIVALLGNLTRQGQVVMTERQTPYGDSEYRYAVTRSVDADLPLSAEDWLFINAVAHEYGGKSLAAVKRAAYETAPMQGVQQFDVLELKENSDIKHRHERILSNERFMGGIVESLRLKEQGEVGVSLKELKVLLAE